MWDLEYLLLFGVPGNKWEILDGRVRWAFPFLARDVAQAHFAAWTDTLRRWRNGVEPTAHETTTADGSPRSIVRFDGVEMSLYPRPIELLMPMDMDVFDGLYHSFWRRDLWPGQVPEDATGWESAQRHYDVQLNLWKLFGEFRRVSAGEYCGRVAIVLDDRNAVEPDQYYFQSRPDECMIEGDYFQGVPRLIAEVLSPSTRALDRGQRMEVYRQAGVPHLWLLDPETETVEEYTLAGRTYSRTGRHGPGESFPAGTVPRGIGRRGLALRYAGETTRTPVDLDRARTRAHVAVVPGSARGAGGPVLPRASRTALRDLGQPRAMPFGVRFARRSRVAFRAFPRRHLQMGTGIFAQALPDRARGRGRGGRPLSADSPREACPSRRRR